MSDKKDVLKKIESLTFARYSMEVNGGGCGCCDPYAVPELDDCGDWCRHEDLKGLISKIKNIVSDL